MTNKRASKRASERASDNMNFNTGKNKKTLDKTLDIFDKFLDDITTSKISNTDYNILHKIFDKYLEIEKQQASKQKG